MCENRIMKPIKIGLKRGRDGGQERVQEGSEFDQRTLCALWKYHNETPLYN
jgi:hypothetical protein